MKAKREIIAVPTNKKMPFSTVVGFENLVFVSGLVGRNFETERIAQGDIAEQTRQTLVNIEEQLTRAGLSLENVIKATVFVTDMALFEKMNHVYVSFFKSGLPARSCVQVAALPDSDALVEIEVIAHR